MLLEDADTVSEKETLRVMITMLEIHCDAMNVELVIDVVVAFGRLMLVPIMGEI